MLEQKALFGELFSRAGIAIDGPNPWDIQVTDERFYTRLLRDQSLGLGEAYMEGLWRCRQLSEFIFRVLNANLEQEIKGGVRFLLPYLTALFFNPQSRRRARQVAEKH